MVMVEEKVMEMGMEQAEEQVEEKVMEMGMVLVDYIDMNLCHNQKLLYLLGSQELDLQDKFSYDIAFLELKLHQLNQMSVGNL